MTKTIALGILLASAYLVGCATPATSMRGIYLSSGGVDAFQPCGSKAWFLVVGKPAVLDPLRNRALDLGGPVGRPSEPFYVEAMAAPEPKPADAAAAYEGAYRFVDVTTIGESIASSCPLRN